MMRVQRYLLPCILVLAATQHVLQWRLSQEFNRHMQGMRLPLHLVAFSELIRDEAKLIDEYEDVWPEKCAINFFGLPRAFHLVLPSIVKHVILPNQAYRCDYFIHFYNQTFEVAGRSGSGGIINTRDILGLRQAVHQVGVHKQGAPSNTSRQPAQLQAVLFASDTNTSFYQSHRDIIQVILTARDETGSRSLYHPWLERDYDETPIDGKNTMLNILKLWHSVDRSWKLMEEYGRRNRVNYTRVAMLRSDVIFLTPLDIWDAGVPSSVDLNNTRVVIPSFARYPVNDRAIYGNARGVRKWATARFTQLAQHVEYFRGSGYVMHHERFLDATVFAAIRQDGIKVVEHPVFCFCRARSDNRVWFNDCTKGNAPPSLQKAYPDASSWLQAVALAVNRTCHDVRRENVSGAVSVLCE